MPTTILPNHRNGVIFIDFLLIILNRLVLWLVWWNFFKGVGLHTLIAPIVHKFFIWRDTFLYLILLSIRIHFWIILIFEVHLVEGLSLRITAELRLSISLRRFIHLYFNISLNCSLLIALQILSPSSLFFIFNCNSNFQRRCYICPLKFNN